MAAIDTSIGFYSALVVCYAIYNLGWDWLEAQKIRGNPLPLMLIIQYQVFLGD
jgi:hypothetical protein